MVLRVGFDVDGVLADFASAYHAIEARLFADDVSTRADDPEQEEAQESAGAPRGSDRGQTGVRPPGVADGDAAMAALRQKRRRRDAIWREIRSTHDFWTTLQPIDANAVRRIHGLTLRHRWEAVFITQRPATRGDTVQRQTQRWLVEQGFDLPSVVVIAGSRGAAAAALRLHYLVDDSAQNCLDVVSDSGATPILIAAASDEKDHREREQARHRHRTGHRGVPWHAGRRDRRARPVISTAHAPWLPRPPRFVAVRRSSWLAVRHAVRKAGGAISV